MRTVKCRFSPVLKKSTTYSPPPKAAHALKRGLSHSCKPKRLKEICQGNTDLLEILQPKAGGKITVFIFTNRKQKIGNVTFPLRRQGSQVLQHNLQKIVKFNQSGSGFALLKLRKSEGVLLKISDFFQDWTIQNMNPLKT